MRNIPTPIAAPHGERATAALGRLVMGALAVVVAGAFMASLLPTVVMPLPVGVLTPAVLRCPPERTIARTPVLPRPKARP